MLKHNFKLGQYYIRKVDGLVYIVKDCKRGTATHELEVRNCKDCKSCLMLAVLGNAHGYCIVPGIHSNKIRKLTKLEVLLKDY